MPKLTVFEKETFYILTGGPGVGKTTLLDKLESFGYQVVPEVARGIIKHQMETGGEGLPWKNKEYYTTLMLDGSVDSYLKTYQTVGDEIVFFDRGIPDTFCYAGMIGMEIPEEMRREASRYRYNKNVFLLPAWKDIYETDSERKQSWEEAVYTYEMMKKAYGKNNYHIIEVPKIAVDGRAGFILERIGKGI